MSLCVSSLTSKEKLVRTNVVVPQMRMAWNVEVCSTCHVTSHEVYIVIPGADNGNCSCITDVNADVNAGVNGKCECNDTRFTGDSCDCPIDTTACMTEVSFYFVWR